VITSPVYLLTRTADAAGISWSGPRLLAIAPVAGLGRVVTAVPGAADAFGYDIEAALEDPDDH
jgi:hypothetical protein